MNFSFVFNSPKEQEKKKKTDLQAIGEKVTSFFWDVAPEHGFEMREGQQDMSFEIVDALIHDQHFAVEAGVGIGKSFGYLVPVLLYNKQMKKPVIVATSTIALQAVSYTHLDVYKRQAMRTALCLYGSDTHAGQAGCDYVRHRYGQVGAVRAAEAVEGVFLLQGREHHRLHGQPDEQHPVPQPVR